MPIENPSIDKLQAVIDDCRIRDRHRFVRALKKLRQTKGQKPTTSLKNIQQDIEKSRNYVDERRLRLPNIELNTELPIFAHISELSEKLKQHQLLVVCGETGSGKTTQLPKLCLQAGYGFKGLIGHTQPRRLAAKSIANRLSKELDMPLGKGVGYKIRHTDRTSDETYIKLMTDGVLLAEMQSDRWLNEYEVLIIDEAHERSLNIDFILGYLKQLLPTRPDLKVIITSATIDVEQFSEHFDQAPIIQVEGRGYPVEVRYRPLEDEEGFESQSEVAVLEAIHELGHIGLGDILVFLPGEREIHEMLTYLRKQSLSNTEILPLYSRLTAEAQSKIFKPHNKRHIILATNIAETSLTIPGISFVIDLGYAKISRYSCKSKVQRLPVEKVSQAAANQRKGRCGRTHEGVCIRLYSEEDFEKRSRFTEPEILRTNLATVILQMKSMRLGELSEFPFITAPNVRYINDGLRLLNELSALDKHHELTVVGKELSRLPVDPRLGAMLIASKRYHCVSEILIITSALSILDPRERPLDEPGKADQAHSQFDHPHSDFLRYLNLWNFYSKQSAKLSKNQLRKLCKTNYLSYTRMNEWKDIHKQLTDMVSEMDFQLNTKEAQFNNIHCSIISGLLSHIAVKDDNVSYLGARSTKLYVFPGSSQFKTQPKWIMAAEIAETSKLYARTVAKIDPKWVIKPAKHLLQRTHVDPHWDEQKQQITAYENISLYGLVIVTKQPINFGKVNPKEAKRLFIEEALIHLKLESSAEFYAHNQTLIDNVRLKEAKTRRQDKLDEEAILNFYQEKLPNDVCSLQTLDNWRKTIEKEQPEYLFLNEQNVMRDEKTIEFIDTFYPDSIQLGKTTLSLTYEYAPEEKDDGVSLEIPIVLLSHLDEERCETLVPGLLKERLTHYIKSLPKSIRKQFVPLPNFIEECEHHLEFNSGNLMKLLIEYVFRTRGIKIRENDFNVQDMPEYLFLNYKILDESGQCIIEGRNLSDLKSSLEDRIEHMIVSSRDIDFHREHITTWDFNDLPVVYETIINGIHVDVYPALTEENGCLSVKSFETEKKAYYEMKHGLNHLFQNYLRKEIKYISKNLFDKRFSLNLLNTHYTEKKVMEEVVYKIIEHDFIEKYGITRTKDGFEVILNREKVNLISKVTDLMPLIYDIFKQYQTALGLLREKTKVGSHISLEDIQSQLSLLMCSEFIQTAPFEWLEQYPKYLMAIIQRLKKLEHSLEKEQQKLDKIQPYWKDFIEMHALGAELGLVDEEMMLYRWMLEEYRVSLFAQGLKTSVKISAERLDKQRNIIRNNSNITI